MKNIQILPTDQPSRLVKNNEGELKLTTQTLPFDNIIGCYPQSIYITSDEEIKSGDWIENNGKIYKCTATDNFYVTVYEKNKYAGSFDTYTCKKIILSTDPTLIADGVQSIDDNFLKWFVKNPSCEFVEVKEKSFNEIEKELGIYGHDIGLTENEYSEWLKNGGQLYKIIIPQEGDKKIYDMPLATHDTGKTCTTKQEEPKQEKEEYFKHLEKDKKEFAEEWEEIRQEFGLGKQDSNEDWKELEDAKLCEPLKSWDEPKHSTLEEAAEKEFPLIDTEWCRTGACEEENLHLLGHRKSFIKGAKSDAARDYWFKVFKEQFKKK